MSRGHKYFDPILRDIYRFWVEQIKIDFFTSKYIDFTVQDFYIEFQNSKDLPYFYPDLYLYLDHYSFLPTHKSIRENQEKRWLLPVQALATML